MFDPNTKIGGGNTEVLEPGAMDPLGPEVFACQQRAILALMAISARFPLIDIEPRPEEPRHRVLGPRVLRRFISLSFL